LSEEGKEHGRKLEEYNRQASEFIFRENNSNGRVAADTIDLHGQFVEEAEQILEERIKYASSHGQTHLHVIVGKGNHSVNHIQKIKPRVEQVCRELGLQYATEENTGRIYINLTGGPAVMPPEHHYYGGDSHNQHQYQQQQPQQQAQYGGQQQSAYPGQPQYPGQQSQQQNENVEEIVNAVAPGLMRKLGSCCVVM